MTCPLRLAIGSLAVVAAIYLSRCGDTNRATKEKARWPSDTYKHLAIAPPPQTLWQRVVGIAASPERDGDKLRSESAIAAIELLKKEAASGGQFVELTTITEQEPFVLRLIAPNGAHSFDMHAQGGRVHEFPRQRGNLLTSAWGVSAKARPTRVRLLDPSGKLTSLPLNAKSTHRWPTTGFIKTYPQTLLVVIDFKSDKSVVFLQSVYRRAYGTGRSHLISINIHPDDLGGLNQLRMAFERKESLGRP